MNNMTTAPTTLIMRHTFNAPIERVFDAWTTPEVMREFYCPGEIACTSIDVDLRVGGSYRIVMRQPDGEDYVSYGTYREILRPSKIVCTQQWEEDDTSLEHQTLLTLAFAQIGNQTELTLTQVNLRDEASRDRHAEGWGACLSKLERVLG